MLSDPESPLSAPSDLEEARDKKPLKRKRTESSPDPEEQNKGEMLKSFGTAIGRFRHNPVRVTRSTSSRAAAAAAEHSVGGNVVKKETATPTRRTIKKEYISADAKTIKVEDVEVKNEVLKKEGAPKRAQRGIKVDKTTGTVTPPPDWEEIYNRVLAMRAEHKAPVDTMGCERLAHPDASEKDRRFHTLISLMLSSQTKDTVTAVVVRRMQEELPGGLNLQDILDMEPARLDELIRPVGFHNRKTEYIKKTAEILRDKYNGDIPDTIEGLTSLPGVGPKMAYLCLSHAWNRTEGIGVDVHVHRITNLWRWHKTNTPEETRHALESWLPRDKWREINWLLVGFGQSICLPRTPKCNQCTLADGKLCPAVVNWKKKTVKKTRLKLEEGEGIEDALIKKEEEQEDVKIKSEIDELAHIQDIEDVIPNVKSPRSKRSTRSTRVKAERSS